MADIPPAKATVCQKRRPLPGRRFWKRTPGKEHRLRLPDRAVLPVAHLLFIPPGSKNLPFPAYSIGWPPGWPLPWAVGFRQRPQVLLPCSAQDQRQGVTCFCWSSQHSAHTSGIPLLPERPSAGTCSRLSAARRQGLAGSWRPGRPWRRISRPRGPNFRSPFS